MPRYEPPRHVIIQGEHVKGFTLTDAHRKDGPRGQPLGGKIGPPLHGTKKRYTGWQALSVAAIQSGSVEPCLRLLNRGRTVLTTTLHWAVSNPPAHARTVLLLVFAIKCRGIDIDAADDLGRTALMVAAFYGHAQFVAVLIAAGANVLLVDDSGMTAAELAQSGRHRQWEQSETICQCIVDIIARAQARKEDIEGERGREDVKVNAFRQALAEAEKICNDASKTVERSERKLKKATAQAETFKGDALESVYEDRLLDAEDAQREAQEEWEIAVRFML